MRKENLPNSKFTYLHPLETIKSWIKHLNYFYFYQSRGGIGDDNGQSFKTRIKYTDRTDLINKFKLLKIPINYISDDTPKPIPGKSYTWAEHQKFKKGIKRFPEIEQPRNTKILKHNCHVWVFDNDIEISIGGNGTEEEIKYWLVGQDDFNICLALEKKLSRLPIIYDINREVENDERYISKTYYSNQIGL